MKMMNDDDSIMCKNKKIGYFELDTSGVFLYIRHDKFYTGASHKFMPLKHNK